MSKRQKLDFKPDAGEIRKLRNEHGISLTEAKRILVGAKLREVINHPNGHLGDLRDIVAQIIEDMYP